MYVYTYIHTYLYALHERIYICIYGDRVKSYIYIYIRVTNSATEACMGMLRLVSDAHMYTHTHTHT